MGGILTVRLTFKCYINGYRHKYRLPKYIFAMSRNIVQFNSFVLDLNKRVTKTITKREIAKQAAEDDLELSDRILQTIFSIRTEESSIDLLSATSDEFEILYKKIKYPNTFSILSKRILNFMCTANDSVKTLICYIAANIEYMSNKIELNEDVINRTTLNHEKLKVAIRVLKENEFIISTTKKGLYVVNHNHIFFGDYNKFIRAYIKLYRKALRPETTYDGKKIILPKDYGK